MQSARRQARAEAIAELREAVESGTYSERAMFAAEQMTPDQLVHFQETGELPPDIEFSHLFSASEYPEFAHRGDLGVLAGRAEHRSGHHGGDTSVPLHGTPRDPHWRETWGTQEMGGETAAGREYLGMEAEDINAELARDYPHLFPGGGPGGGGGPSPGGGGPGPGGGGAPPAAPASGGNVPPTAATPTPTSGAAPLSAEPAAFAAPVTAAPVVPETAVTPVAPVHTAAIPETVAPVPPTIAAPAAPTIEGTAPMPASPSQLTLPLAPAAAAPRMSVSATSALAGVPTWAAASRAATLATAQGAAQAPATAAGGAGAAAPAAPGVASQVGQLFLPQLFGPGGEPPTQEELAAAHSAKFAAGTETEPGVERVNPDYPDPPGTPAQLETIQAEILNLATAEAQAEQAQSVMTSQEGRHRANQAPLASASREMDGGISAAQRHQEAVQRREQVNREQQQRQQEGQGLIAGYPSRAAGLTALTVPLSAFERFSHYASKIPGRPGQAMKQMNNDARKMQDAFAQMAVAMATQNDEQPARQAELQGDQGRLEQTGEQGATSEEQLTQARDGAQGLEEANAVRLEQATAAREEAGQQCTELHDAGAVKEEQARSLSEQLKAWAPVHKGARDGAIEEVEARLTEEGSVVRRA